MELKIGVDLRPLQSAYRWAGVGVYAENLSHHLLQQNGLQQFVFFTFRGREKPTLAGNGFSWAVWRPSTTRHPALWEQLLLPWDIKRSGVDVYHVTGALSQVWEIGVPYLQPCHLVVTVHDLHPLILSQFDFLARAPMFRLQLHAVQKAKRLIAHSESTKRDMIRLLGIPPERIRVIYSAPASYYKPIKNPVRIRMFRNQQGLPERFILYVGNYHRYKNIEVVLSSMIHLKPAVPLVVVGSAGSYDSVRPLMQKLGIEARVLFKTGLSYADLAMLYNCATLLVCPSQYEGFGYPPLEAMACGCPVVSSNRASLPEVVGNGGVLLDPEDESGWIENIQTLLEDQVARDVWRKRGLIQASEFSWDKTAAETIRVYQESAML